MAAQNSQKTASGGRPFSGNTKASRKPAGAPRAQQSKSLKRKRNEEDVESLSQRVANFNTQSSTSPITFADLPLSGATQSGLEGSHFKTLTTIQAKSIPASLMGTDILGAAKTGSGKTLAFLIPVLENLYRKQWTEHDGVGALILSPTRELSIQIFEVLRKVGRNHAFSAGLVIGGKSLQEERARLGRMNILVATPGRMLQHMDQTADLEIGNLEMLVLDEADRIMDMGFKDTVDAIIEHLPRERQTLMFSATQTKRVSDLARLAIRDAEFVSVHEGAESATPSTLQQNYTVTPLPEKIDTLWSFIRANLKKKILVFLSSGKQVRFVYEALRHLQPGTSLLHIHGRQKQTSRLDIITRFSSSQHACLFATDVAARGLDFPAVDWVVQLDCPEDAETYIHRVGRTARYERVGRAIMFLDPSEEEGALNALSKKNVSVEKINVRQKKMQNSIRNQLQNMCFKDPELKYLGQKAFVSYVRSIHVQKDKATFKLNELDLEDYAASLGLPGAPRVKFMKGDDAKARKNAPRQLLAISSGDEENDGVEPEKPVIRTKYDRMFERRNQDVLADHYTKMIGDDERPQTNGEKGADADEDNDFLAVKRRFDAGDAALGEVTSESEDSDEYNEAITDAAKSQRRESGTSSIAAQKKKINLSNNPDETLLVDSKRREKLLKSKKKLLKFKGHGSHLHFDDDAVPHEAEYYDREEEFAKRGLPEEQREAFLREEAVRTQAADLEDKALAKRKRREKKEKNKARDAAENEDDDEDGPKVAYLAPPPEGEVEAAAQLQSPQKRAKKWFEDVSSGDEVPSGQQQQRKQKKASPSEDQIQEPQTLEDLEALASGLLGR